MTEESSEEVRLVWTMHSRRNTVLFPEEKFRTEFSPDEDEESDFLHALFTKAVEEYDGEILLLPAPGKTTTGVHRKVGTLAKIIALEPDPEDKWRVTFEGQHCEEVTTIISDDEDDQLAMTMPFSANIAPENTVEAKDALKQATQKINEFLEVIDDSEEKETKDLREVITEFNDSEIGTNFITQYILQTLSDHSKTSAEEKYDILTTKSPVEKFKKLCFLIDEKIEEQQEEELETELDEDEEAEEKHNNDLETIESWIENTRLPQDVYKSARRDLTQLQSLPPQTETTQKVREHIDHLMEMPWNKQTKTTYDIPAAQIELDKDHLGLKKPKERILEFLSVRKRTQNEKGGVIALVGPPGVGKTSLARAIAKTLNRKFARLSLGGAHDESKIRGHGYTFHGSGPGEIVKKLQTLEVNNPVILLDETDKTGSSHQKHTPASAALLEVLDPEQHDVFHDSYLGVGVDLSNILFIISVNSIKDIPAELTDRTEVIEISGYTMKEKLDIARLHLLPRKMKNTGLSAEDITITDDALNKIIEGYSLEPGLRELDRTLGKICRKIAKNLETGGHAAHITPENLRDYIDEEIFVHLHIGDEDQIGVAYGLHCSTILGGGIIPFETAIVGKEKKLTCSHTGNFGKDLGESAVTVQKMIRSKKEEFNLVTRTTDEKGQEKIIDHTEVELHLHAIDAATPKDGPSAGTTIATALYSRLAGEKIRRDVGMTGEITLNGCVLEIGGLREKLIGAERSGIKKVIVPDDNAAELKKLLDELKPDIEVITASNIRKVFHHALVRGPELFPLDGKTKPALPAVAVKALKKP